MAESSPVCISLCCAIKASSVLTGCNRDTESNTTEFVAEVSSTVSVKELEVDENIFFALLDTLSLQFLAARKLFGVESPFRDTSYKLGNSLPSPIASSVFLYRLFASVPVPNTKKTM